METTIGDRIIVLVDMDCFYVQVEQNLCPEFQTKPCAVVQYNTWKGGGIIAVNYEARDKGVTRMLRGDEAQKLCPEIHLFRVPEVRGKADLTRYREAGAKVMDVLCEYSDCVERASIDEAYLDMTTIINSKMQSAPPITVNQLPNTFVVGWDNKDPEARKVELQKWLQMIYEEEHLYNDRMLAVAAVIVEDMRAAVYEKTGYRCSAGVAHNKMLAKLCCGINKPNKQTVLPQSSIQLLFNTISVKKVRNLGGKLGEEIVKKFSAEKMGDLFHVHKSQFVSQYGEKTGHWLYNLARGIDNEPVSARQLPKSIGCGKNFPGKKSLSTKDEVTHWLKQLSTELEERLVKDQESNRRVAHLLTVSVRNHENGDFSMVSRSCPIRVYNAEKIAHDAFSAISKLNTSSSETIWKPSIWTLSMAASKFEDKLYNSHCNIQAYLVDSRKMSANENVEMNLTLSSVNNSNSENKLNNLSLAGKSKKRPSKSIHSFFAKISASESDLAGDLQNLNNSKNNVFTENGNESSMLQDCCNAIDSLLGNQDAKSSVTVKNITGFFGGKQICQTDSVKFVESTDEIANMKVSDQSLLLSDSCVDINNAQNGTTIDPSIDEFKTTSVDENSSSLLVKKSSNTKEGFFAKKQAERTEYSIGVDFSDKLCDFDSIVTKCDKSSNVISVTSKFDYCDSKPSTSVANKVHFRPVLNSTTITEENMYSNLDPELTKLCDKCKKHIPIWEEEEHLDYHIAVDLSKEFSTNPVVHRTSVKSASGKITATSKSRCTGKKRGNMTKSSTQSKKTLVQTNTLDAFLKR